MKRHTLQPSLGGSLVTVAVFVASLVGAGSQVRAQNPLFPNTQPAYYNPYGFGPYGRYNNEVYGRPFPFKPLPAAYSQPLPTPGVGYNNVYPIAPAIGGRAYLRSFSGNGVYYNPYGYVN